MERLIATSHVGLMGDAIYSLPTIRELCKKYNCKADFYTTPACAPLVSLFEAQSCINQVIVTDKFVNDCKSIPWRVFFTDIDHGKYVEVLDLSFKTFPDCPLPEFIAKSAGLSAEVGKQISYECPSNLKQRLIDVNLEAIEALVMGDYLVMAPRATKCFNFRPLLDEIARRSPLPVMIVGKPGEMISNGHDLTNLTVLQMTTVISRAKGYIGLLSGPLTIAHGFDIPKAVIFDGFSWDPRHVIRDGRTEYLANPSADQVLKIFKGVCL